MNNKAGKQLTIVLHVDDMLLTCEDESTIQDVLAAIEARYPDTTVGCGPKINFLGMSMDFEVKGECAVTMNGMVDDVVDKAEVDGTATTPAASTLFEVDESKCKCISLLSVTAVITLEVNVVSGFRTESLRKTW